MLPAWLGVTVGMWDIGTLSIRVLTQKYYNWFCQYCPALPTTPRGRVLPDSSDEVFCWASTNSPAMWQLLVLQDALQQLTSHSEPEPRQLHAYCCTTHKNRWFIWTMCLSCWWALTAQVCQRHLCCARNRKPANLPSNAHDFESSALCVWTLLIPEPSGVTAATHVTWFSFVTTAPHYLWSLATLNTPAINVFLSLLAIY